MLNAVAKKITVLVNDALNTFYLQFYDVKTCLRSIQMRGNLLSELHIYIRTYILCMCVYVYIIPKTGCHTIVEHWLK